MPIGPGTHGGSAQIAITTELVASPADDDVAGRVARSHGRHRLPALPLVACGLAVVATVAFAGRIGHRWMGIVPAALALAAIGVGTRRFRPETATAWYLLGVGHLALVVGSTEWSGAPPAHPSVRTWATAAVLVLGYALGAIGLVVLARHLTRLWDRTRWIDSVVVSAAAGLVAVALTGPSAGSGVLPRVVLPLLPAVDLLLVLLATRAVLAVSQRTPSLLLLGGGLLAAVLGEVAVRWVGLDAGVWLPVTWIASSTALAAAALHPSVGRTPLTVIPWRRTGAVRFTVLVLSMAAPLVALICLAVAGNLDRSVAATLATGAIVIGVLVLIRISGLVTYADRIAEAHHGSRFEAMAHHSLDVVTILDPRGTITWSAPATETVLGRSPASVQGAGLGELLGHEAAQLLENPLGALARRGNGESVTVEVRARHADGRIRVVEGFATNLLDDDAVQGIVLTVRDVTQRHRLEQELVTQAFVDPLTGLANRALFSDRVEHAVARSGQEVRMAAVLFIDLDDFKEVNDTLGHELGDDVLATVGRRITEALGPVDTAARLGGDEFAVLLEDTDEHQADEVARRILHLLAVPIRMGDEHFALGASIGIAFSERGARTGSVLLRNADLAMYEAKRNGKRGIARYRVELHQREVRHFRFRNELRAAVAADEMRLHYQPIVDLATGVVAGAEALVRWQHPTQGLLPPDEFIAAAEANRSIIPIGRWVLETACRQAATWNSELGPLMMDVNVSPIQLVEPGFVDEVAAILDRTGVNPRQIVVELTESILIHDAAAAREVLQALRQLGLRTAIDDFGTGYSSLAYLQEFPIDIVKIDRTFVQQLGGQGQGRSLAQSIIAIAASLGIETIAEGIETPEAAVDLAALSCQQGQGYHYSRPLDADRFADYVRTNRATVGAPAAGVRRAAAPA